MKLKFFTTTLLIAALMCSCTNSPQADSAAANSSAPTATAIASAKPSTNTPQQNDNPEPQQTILPAQLSSPSPEPTQDTASDPITDNSLIVDTSEEHTNDTPAAFTVGKPITEYSPNAKFDNNPIDKDFKQNFADAKTPDEKDVAAAYYLNVWGSELESAATEASAYDDAEQWEALAQAVCEKVVAENKDNDNVNAMVQIAAANVYKDAALTYINKISGYQYRYNTSYMPLLQAIADSEVRHYDNFEDYPDDHTINYTIQSMVANQKIYPGKDLLKAKDDILYFNDYSDDESDPLITADDLYWDYFTNGGYSYPPENFPPLVQATEDGIAVQQKSSDISAKIKVLMQEWDDYDLYLYVSITRKKGFAETELGNATIIVTLSEDASLGYTITSFRPEYEAFSDI